MLASLLPGLRDLRAPFVCGVLILTTVALLSAGFTADVTTPTGRSGRLQDLVEWVGRPGLAATVSLVAYLLGSLGVGGTRGLVAVANRRAMRDFHTMVFGGSAGPSPSPDEMWVVLSELEEDITDLEILRREAIPLLPYRTDSIASLVIALRTDVPEDARVRQRDLTVMELLSDAFANGPRRLRTASEQLFADHDRLKSEAELRDGLLLPLPFTVLAILANIDLARTTEALLFGVTLLLVLLLFSQARRSDRDAHSLVLDALTDHTVSLLPLDPLGWKREGGT